MNYFHMSVLKCDKIQSSETATFSSTTHFPYNANLRAPAPKCGAQTRAQLRWSAVGGNGGMACSGVALEQVHWAETNPIAVPSYIAHFRIFSLEFSSKRCQIIIFNLKSI